MGMGVREYARHRGVAPSAVVKAVSSGRINKEPDGSIDPVNADAAWERNTSPAQQRKPSPGPPLAVPAPVNHVPSPVPASQPAAKQATDAEQVPVGAASPNYQSARAVRETYNAKMARLDYEERLGKLLKAEDVAKDAFETARRVRDRLLGIPSRISAVLASETDSKVIERILEHELRTALEDLSQ